MGRSPWGGKETRVCKSGAKLYAILPQGFRRGSGLRFRVSEIYSVAVTRSAATAPQPGALGVGRFGARRESRWGAGTPGHPPRAVSVLRDPRIRPSPHLASAPLYRRIGKAGRSAGVPRGVDEVGY